MRWILPELQPSGDLIKYLLNSRGIVGDNQSKFLSPGLEYIYSAELLHDSTKAAKVILQAIEDKKKIFIHGDYDVDGVCATAIVWNYLYHHLEANVLPIIPNRFDDGYGLTPSSLDKVLEQGGEVVITVDCGVKDIDIIKEYTQKGIRFIITDHHSLLVGEDGKEQISKDAEAIVHPRHPDGDYPFMEICGTTVAWKLCCAIDAQAKKSTDMYQYLDLVALATVCDVMPLVDENRAIVHFGLQRLRQTRNIGLQVLMQHAGIKSEQIEAYHLGYVLGPRLNASGRMESAMDALRLLTTQSSSYAHELAEKLTELNLKRQQLTQDLLKEAEEQMSRLEEDPLIHFVYGDEWPEGIIGLIAGRLTEKYYRPVIVGSIVDGQLKASARSIPSFHITQALESTKHLLQRYGGHAQAAGFTIKVEDLYVFYESLKELAQKKLTEEDLENTLSIDAIISNDDFNVQLVKNLERLAPFGFGNKKPIFAIMNAQIASIRYFGNNGNKHIAMQIRHPNLNKIEAVGFSIKPDEYEWLEVGKYVNIAGSLEINSWNNKELLQIKIKSIQLVV